ncbi:hypothetical protein CGRA01v4_08331 [Colletotrichum graminicola]|uniref:Zn(2)-C6 fungal-type domain-containing protein n=1 Tax=Colletotrichum graminicola (strain M1.001 / M2 / FGSC 10212) TaxID=645133 RepID=E3QMH9_COLGM|nr:uncharacterized protein GLRG_07211 [Colletotrichum graminicola M1.001]EFQ32067.1 hypothetical protein GLRG_07211 [Colletotrichum graminicola M1.001]WDK17048.1 hypothetical protein CGRA01v4_08331 [Colletotrichum graminicola]
MSTAVGNDGGSYNNFLVPRVPGVSLTEALGHTLAPKRRHVKCDEAKPSCRRCVKWQGFCDGYNTSGGCSASTPGPDSGLDGTPETRASESPPAEKLAADGVEPLLPSGDPNTLPVEVADDLFGDPTERQYFEHWLAYRYRLGGGIFDEPLWSETVPRMSHQHASVRYAAMAVGGIAKALRQSLGPMSPAQMGANGPHYALALSYYGSAIREIRKAELDTGSLQAAIVCCLLFVCFEVLYGDRGAALSHIDNGKKMIDELLRRRREEEEEEKSPPGRSVVGAEAVETDAIHVFQRLIQQSWSCDVLRRRDRDDSEEPRGGEDSESGQEDDYSERSWCSQDGSGGERAAFHEMPSSFATLPETHRWWDGCATTPISERDERVLRHMDEIEMADADGAGRRWDSEDALAGGVVMMPSRRLWAAAREDRDGDEKGWYAWAARAAGLWRHAGAPAMVLV